MISELIDRKTKLYAFMMSRKSPTGTIKFDGKIWEEALDKLSEFNRPEYYFDFEDRLIEEIVLSVLRYPPGKAKLEIEKIKKIVDADVGHKLHCKPFLRSIRNSVAGAVAVAMRCL